MNRAGWILAVLAASTWCQPAGGDDLAELDRRALRAAGVDTSSGALNAELERLGEGEFTDDAVRRFLHIARVAGANNLTECGRLLLRCTRRLREPAIQWVAADAVGRLGTSPKALPTPQALIHTTSPPAVLVAIAIIANRKEKYATNQLVDLAETSGGLLSLRATRAVKALGDERYIRLARKGLMHQDPMLRLAYLRLLEPSERIVGFKVMGTETARQAALSAGKVVQPDSPAPPGLVLVTTTPRSLIEIGLAGARRRSEKLSTTPVLARRLTADHVLLVTRTGFSVQLIQGRLLYQCDLGAGPQNDIVAVGDGTWLVADGGSFSPSLAVKTSGLYIYSPAANEVTWRLATASPLSVRVGPAGTFLIARGRAGLAWVDGRSGRPVRQVRLGAPCLAAEPLANGDVIATAGTKLVRVNPAGAVTWEVDLGGAITSIAVGAGREYFVTVTGLGLLRVDAADLDIPVSKVLFPVASGSSRVTRNP